MRQSRWTVLRPVESINGDSASLCRCSCGTVRVVLNKRIKNGSSKSCGCMRLEIISTHGMKRTSEYKIWSGMKSRCLNPSDPAFKDYGGRGIKVCKRWLKFENFYSDMGPRSRGLTLDRINNDGGYSKSNCRWASRATQSNNRRSNRVIKLNGVSMSLADMVRVTGIGRDKIKRRLNRGWCPEEIVRRLK